MTKCYDIRKASNIVRGLEESHANLLKVCKAFSNISYNTDDENYGEVSRALELAHEAIEITKEVL